MGRWGAAWARAKERRADPQLLWPQDQGQTQAPPPACQDQGTCSSKPAALPPALAAEPTRRLIVAHVGVSSLDPLAPVCGSPSS